MTHNSAGAVEKVKEMFPAPLYESAAIAGDRLCLVCGRRRATSALLTPGERDPIVPLCRDCSADWNTYGYLILRRIRPMPLLWRVTKYFLLGPMRRGIVWQDLRNLQRWQKRMAGLRK